MLPFALRGSSQASGRRQIDGSSTITSAQENMLMICEVFLENDLARGNCGT